MRLGNTSRALLAGVILFCGTASSAVAAGPAAPAEGARPNADEPRAPYISPDMKGCQAMKANRDYYVKYVMPRGKSVAAQKQEPTTPPRSMRDRVVGFFSMK